MTPIPDDDSCYRAVGSRDPRFDGWVYVGVTSTGIYCRPSCPAHTPQRRNCRFFAAAAAAQQAGFRACRRCRPDLVPGSPQWSARTDVAARAMRLITDGFLDRDSVGALAATVGYSERQLHRVLVAEVGAGALAVARAQRAQTARTLVESTRLPMAEVAFAAGFGSVRQFNDTVTAVYARTPSELRSRTGTAASDEAVGGRLRLAVPVRAPYAADALIDFLVRHAAVGVEQAVVGKHPGYARTLALPHGDAVVVLTSPGPDRLLADVVLADLRDLGTLVARVRRIADADADPVAVGATLAADPALAPSLTDAPGLRVPGTPDAAELAVRALVGQQISLAGASAAAAHLARRYGRRATVHHPLAPDLGLVFSEADRLAAADPTELPMPRARGRALVALAAALDDGRVDLGVGGDRGEQRAALLAQPGIGPWTADYVALRGLGDPDVLLGTDLAVRRELDRRGLDLAATRAWAPWRSYATLHLWHAYLNPPKRP